MVLHVSVGRRGCHSVLDLLGVLLPLLVQPKLLSGQTVFVECGLLVRIHDGPIIDGGAAGLVLAPGRDDLLAADTPLCLTAGRHYASGEAEEHGEGGDAEGQG
jgi:hypothetical protein